MHAILYSAGRACRLGPLAVSRHKCLLEFGGKTLFERHVMNLARQNVQKIYVVTGQFPETEDWPQP